MAFLFDINLYVYFVVSTAIVAVLVDLLMGDPHLNYHPVMVIGNTLSKLKNKIHTGEAKRDKLYGILLIGILIILFCFPLYLLQVFIWWLLDLFIASSNPYSDVVKIVLISVMSGFILKWSFAIKNMGDSTKPIAKALQNNDLTQAKQELSMIVRRETTSLTEPFIISATVECIAESSTDAVNSVFWFYFVGNLLSLVLYTFIIPSSFLLFLGLPFAYIYRIINTGDSIVGYKDDFHINIGWFSARMDDVANFVPTRLTVLFMFLAGKIMKLDVKNGIQIFKEFRNKTSSVNAGWTMSTIAGLLGVELEKKKSYKLGKATRDLHYNDIYITYNHFKLTNLLFIFVITLLFALLTIISR